MKYKFLIFFLSIIYIPCFSQHNAWMDTYVYNVQLPKEINNKAGVYITILYNDGPLLSTKKWVGNDKMMIETEFTYHENETNVLNKIKIPITLPAKTYSWIISKKLVNEMKRFPNKFKMEVIATGKPIDDYILPQQFDFNAANALNIKSLIQMSEANRNKKIIQKTNMLCVQQKLKIPKEKI
jgi:hypothetical protein